MSGLRPAHKGISLLLSLFKEEKMMENFKIVNVHRRFVIKGKRPFFVIPGEYLVVYKAHVVAVGWLLFAKEYEKTPFYGIGIDYRKKDYSIDIIWSDEHEELIGGPLPQKLLYERLKEDGEKRLDNYYRKKQLRK